MRPHQMIRTGQSNDWIAPGLALRHYIGVEPIVMLDDEAFLAHLANEARLLAAAFSRGDPAARVPGLDWNLRTVVTHTGAVHRWAADIVERRLATNETGGSAAFWPADADDSRLAVWLNEGAEVLVSTLRSAPACLSCFTFIPGVAPRTFWARRQAHETAIHRVDAEAAIGGPITVVDTAFAQDGLGEIVGAFATEPGFATHRRGRLLLEATDGPAWMVIFGNERNLVTSGDLTGAAADAVVRGTSEELYRWAWNRPVTVATTGDPQVIALWRTVRVE
jgi:uncharacterized protein (TIGR03083 family)